MKQSSRQTAMSLGEGRCGGASTAMQPYQQDYERGDLSMRDFPKTTRRQQSIFSCLDNSSDGRMTFRSSKHVCCCRIMARSSALVRLSNRVKQSEFSVLNVQSRNIGQKMFLCQALDRLHACVGDFDGNRILSVNYSRPDRV